MTDWVLRLDSGHDHDLHVSMYDWQRKEHVFQGMLSNEVILINPAWNKAYRLIWNLRIFNKYSATSREGNVALYENFFH